MNAPVALQASKRANRPSKDTQDITMTDNATTGGDNTDDTTTSDENTNDAITSDDNMDNAITGKASTVYVPLPPCSSGKAKDPGQIKTSTKHATAIAEPSIADPLPDGQATVKASGHTIDLGDVCV